MTLKRLVGWVLFMLISSVFQCSSNSPPGKPIVKQCRSLDKETFTCWWEPSTSDGKEITYRLLYKTERTNRMFECPDYHTAGKNSCFFDKKHTSIWVDYSLTVLAINAFGNTTSDVYKFEVMDIVKPNPPENVTLWLEVAEDIPTIHVTWNPYNTGPKFGWITPKYELRFKKEESNWNIKPAGKQTHFSLYSASPGKLYVVQVRCALDHGEWSEWSNTVFIQVPKSESKQLRFWILVSFFSVTPFFAAVGIMFIKRKFIKQWLLPPVPGPKIKGVDVQLLKNGQCDEVTSALLMNQVLLPGVPWKKQAEEYVVVCDSNVMLIEDQKHTNGMRISNHFHPKPNINSQVNMHNGGQSKEEQTMLGYLVDTSRLGFVNELNCANTLQTEKALSQDKISIVEVKPVETNGYVDIQRQEVELSPMDYSTVKEAFLLSEKQNNTTTGIISQIERLPNDYTRVKEVTSDNTVLLHDPSSTNNTDSSNTNEPAHPVTDKESVCGTAQ